MEQVQWSTPNKSDINRHVSPIESPRSLRTPVKQYESKHKQTAYQNSTGGFTVLPNHITPPSGITKFIAKNPFEANLTNRLHLSVISPTVFTQVSSPGQDSPNFMWSVEELALIKPARIEESPVQQFHCSDPEIEIKAQAAIDKFFRENKIFPSPWDSKRKDLKKIEISTPTRPQEDLNSTRDSHKAKKDIHLLTGWTQTLLSLPPDLPKDLEEALKPYFTFTQEQQQVENDEANLSNSSLRRKLFFNHDDNLEDDQYSLMSLSPVQSHGLMKLGVTCSPTQSGMLLEGLPLKRSSRKLERDHGTPIASASNLSPPSISPIGNNNSNISCQSIRSRVSRSVARLDFTTDMSIEASVTEEKKTDKDDERNDSMFSYRSTLGTSMLCTKLCSSTEDIDKFVEPQKLKNQTKPNETIEMILLGNETTQVEYEDQITEDSSLTHRQQKETVNRLKLAADWCKLHSNESYAYQNNTFAGISGQQSTFNFAQDTGYQTQSMNSTSMHENANASPTKSNIRWDERILTHDDEMHMSDWKRNIQNIYSSTPSKDQSRDN
ncbi:uncharacterized protein LOC124181173 isoform X1 [Neodiprion fabricii]|uniref:uncharacterized protein LOC124181173 isoform X1 n=1 Tax=Neodiprion fabricii TaxID=2872261 RepID=UPI001ED8D53F|nr:uncharacterized protein LOC124181173 isoform X1 [Neodiprion fabricii]